MPPIIGDPNSDNFKTAIPLVNLDLADHSKKVM